MKGISPLVATILLIGIVVVLATTLYFLSTTFLQESTQTTTNFVAFDVEVYINQPNVDEVTAFHRAFLAVNEPKTFVEAARYCASRGYVLTQFYANSFSTQLTILPSGGWVGVYQKVGSTEPDGGWTIIPDFQPTSLPWDTNQPDNTNGVEHVAHLRSNGKLNDLNALETLPFICERTLITFSILNGSDKTILPEDIRIALFYDYGTSRRYLLQESALSRTYTISVNTPNGVESVTFPFFICKPSSTLKPKERITCNIVMLEFPQWGILSSSDMKLCVRIGGNTVCKSVT